MRFTQLKCFLVLMVFAIIAVGPISPTCLIGMWVVVMRPAWCWSLVDHLYKNIPVHDLKTGVGKHSVATRIKCFLSLLSLFVIDISPIPISEFIGLFIVLVRPIWFYQLVATMYEQF